MTTKMTATACLKQQHRARSLEAATGFTNGLHLAPPRASLTDHAPLYCGTAGVLTWAVPCLQCPVSLT